MDPFNIEELWKFYLEKIEVTEGELHPIQLKETKQAFTAGCTEMFLVLVYKLPKLPKKDALSKVESFKAQFSTLFDEFKTLHDKLK